MTAPNSAKIWSKIWNLIIKIEFWRIIESYFFSNNIDNQLEATITAY